MKKDGIIVNGHMGTWHVIDTQVVEGKTLYLLEHETYGDEAACIIVKDTNNVINFENIVLEDVWNGFDDLDC